MVVKWVLDAVEMPTRRKLRAGNYQSKQEPTYDDVKKEVYDDLEILNARYTASIMSCPRLTYFGV